MTAAETERFAARRLMEAQRELKLALEKGDASRILVAKVQLNYARNDLRRAIAAGAVRS